MTFYSFLLFLVPILIGFFLVHLLWPKSNAYLLKLALGMGAGLGLVSLLYFVFLLFFAGDSGFFVIQLVLLIVLAGLSFRSLKQNMPSFSLPKISWIQSVLFVGLMVVTLLAAATLISTTLRRPHGGFDAWLIWNRASRFIYRGGAGWKIAFSPSFYFFFHVDYPLFLPLNNAWVWNVLKNETLRTPFVQGAIYLFGAALLLFSAVYYSRGFAQASLATIILLGTATFLQVGSAQMADIPLALLILTATVLFYLNVKTDNMGLLALAGFVVGLCGWMKNEGDAFILFGSFAFVLMSIRGKNRAERMLWYLGGLAFPLIVILYFKLTLAPASDLAQSSAQVFQKVTDPSRYEVIWNYILDEVKNFGGWLYLIPTLVVYYFISRDQDGAFANWRLANVLALVLQVLGYIGVYVITTMPLEFHLSTSFSRILLHVFPAFLFILFSSTVALENIFSSPQINPH